MPISCLRLSRLLLASGLLMLLTFASARAQEAPVDPGLTDIPLPEQQPAGFEPVSQLAVPEIDYQNCAPVPQSWHPPIYYPSLETACPTGVVHRDWWREKTLGFFAGHRQRMLEKDYQWRMENAWQSPCCTPHSCWGHPCDCCNGPGCYPAWRVLAHAEECHCQPHCHCWEGTEIHAEPVMPHEPAPLHGAAMDEAVSPIVPAVIEPAPVAEPVSEITSATSAESETVLAAFEDEPAVFADEPGRIRLICGIQPVGENANPQVETVETAGFCQISDGCSPRSCSPGSACQSHGHCLHSKCRHCLLHGHHCPLHGHRCLHGHHCLHCLHGHHCFLFGGHGYDECEDDHCHCPLCCLKGKWWRCLYGDCPPGPHHWPRDLPPIGCYRLAYPVNPHHFDARDGRIYAAQGYGHPVAVPLAPNVEHTYNYGWGVPSSRLSPVSRMPGAPGVAMPPGPAGPGVYPPVYVSPFPGGVMSAPDQPMDNGQTGNGQTDTGNGNY